MILERPQNVEKSTTSQANPGDQIISLSPGNGITKHAKTTVKNDRGGYGYIDRARS